MIKTIPELIERLEAIKADLDPNKLSMRQFDQLGWARRPLDAMLERCREESDEHEARQGGGHKLQLKPLAKCGAR